MLASLIVRVSAFVALVSTGASGNGRQILFGCWGFGCIVLYWLEMKISKVTYAEVLEPKPEWLEFKALYELKNSFLVICEVLGSTNGVPDEVNMLIRLEYPKSLLRKFKKLHGL